MVKCSAPLYGNATYRKTPEITFHRFPKDEKMKIAWLSKMKRENWQPTSASVLCSKHFEAHLIDSSGFRTVLAPGAIPTIFDSLQENMPSAASDNILPDVQNLQPSTSTLSLSQQDVMPTKGPTKRSASGHHIFPAMPNVQLSTSTASCQYTIPTRVLRDIQNVQLGACSAISNYTTPTSTNTSEGQVLREIQNVQPGLLSESSNHVSKLSEVKFLMFKGNVNYTGLIMHVADSSNYCADLKTNDDHDYNHLHLLVRVIVKFYIDLRKKDDAKQTNLSDRNY